VFNSSGSFELRRSSYGKTWISQPLWALQVTGSSGEFATCASCDNNIHDAKLSAAGLLQVFDTFWHLHIRQSMQEHSRRWPLAIFARPSVFCLF
jgi:hypothetical protein